MKGSAGAIAGTGSAGSSVGGGPGWGHDAGSRVARGILSAVGLVIAAYGVLLRPRLNRWGATDAEVSGPYPSR
jgi:hypothetical protein